MPNKVRHGKRLYKQMAMEVAVRNPERYPAVLAIIAKYEGKILDDACILDIYADLFIRGAVESKNIDIDTMSREDIKFYIKTKVSHNNEWGFPTGYQAAFTRDLKTLSELGFVYTQYEDEIRISAVSKALLSGQLELSEAFALQCMRFWRKSPYRRVLNDYNFFEFILKVMSELKRSGRSLSYPQFILSLFSDDGNIDDFIKTLSTVKSGNDIDATYRYITEKYSEKDKEHAKVLKQHSVIDDYGNTVFRVLQLTGLISVENKSGLLLISINEDRYNFLQYLLSQKFGITEEAKESEELYFLELGALPDELKNGIISHRGKESSIISNYNTTLDKVVKDHAITEAKVIAWIKALSSDNKDKIFWYIQKPLKLEFYISILIYLKYGNEYAVKPNYKADDKGIPYRRYKCYIRCYKLAC